MASRPTEAVRARGKGYVAISGSFAPNGSSALSSASTYGAGFSAAYTSTGLFTITFDEEYSNLISANATLQLASADDKLVQIGSYSAANRTLEIRVWDVSGAAVADVSANANNRINFHCVFKNAAPFK